MLPLRARADLGVHCIPQRSSITGASPSNSLVSYPEHSLWKSYSSTEKQLVYSAAPNPLGQIKKDLAVNDLQCLICNQTKPNHLLSVYKTNYKIAPYQYVLEYAVCISRRRSKQHQNRVYWVWNESAYDSEVSSSTTITTILSAGK